ncbi:hypothetical protein [Luteipulveratus mongoliensis]|uniref:Uncharacterized protein n=1 Tax=Luteipulveratus mongoliensis TaxID=571913 RepID=A0A0K1JE90_9MICO|nr:hypothetical protein [Luteipulveratus mongoliensis]AKU15032.1 hypothetical protein VV02_02765 [Luteipulveratus mongoliensis]
MTDTGDSTMPHAHERLPAWAVFPVAALLSWVIGALPWIVSGMRLEISDAWPDFLPGHTPRVALPFGEYAVQPLLTVGVIGGAAAMAASLLARPSVRHPRVLAAAGASVGLLVALWQTVMVAGGSLADLREARLLVAGLIATLVVASAIGMVAGAGLAAHRGLVWPLGGALVASLAGPWFNDLVHRGVINPSWTNGVAKWNLWIGGVVLGLVLAAYGIQRTHLPVWLGALAVLWVMPAALIALNYVTYYGTRNPIRRGTVSEVLDGGRDVFVKALEPHTHVIGPLILAAVIGVLGEVARSARSTPALSADAPAA